MGYLLTLGAVFFSAIKGYFGKYVGYHIKSFVDAVVASCLRMVFCSIIGLALLAVRGELSLLATDGALLLIFLLSGTATATFIIFWLLSVRSEAFLLLEAFTTAGVIVPVGLSLLVFGEGITLAQVLGIGLLIITLIIMTSYGKDLKGKISVSSFLVLACAGIACGLCDFSQKLYVREIRDYNIAVFNSYTYLFATVVIAVFLLVSSVGGASLVGRRRLIGKVVGKIAVMAVAMFIASYCKTGAATFLPSVILYPFCQGIWFMASIVLSAVFFKEKVTYKSVIGIFLIFASLLMINFG